MSIDNRVEDFQAIVDRLYKEIKENGGKSRYLVTIKEIKQCVIESQEKWGIIAEAVLEGKKYGYPPSIPMIEKVETTIFSQSVDTLDIAEVVKAINGLR